VVPRQGDLSPERKAELPSPQHRAPPCRFPAVTRMDAVIFSAAGSLSLQLARINSTPVHQPDSLPVERNEGPATQPLAFERNPSVRKVASSFQNRKPGFDGRPVQFPHSQSDSIRSPPGKCPAFPRASLDRRCRAHLATVCGGLPQGPDDHDAFDSIRLFCGEPACRATEVESNQDVDLSRERRIPVEAPSALLPKSRDFWWDRPPVCWLASRSQASCRARSQRG